MRTLLLLTLSISLAAAEPRTVLIGVQLPVTGERASIGRLMLSGLQMALDTVNARPGDVRLELRLADDESTPEGATKTIEDLAANPDIVAVIGEINSPMVLASAPVVDKEKLPYLTAGSSPRTTVASPWIFRVGASDTLLTAFMTRYITDELHVHGVAILHDKTGIHNQRAAMIAGMPGIKSLLDASWSPGDRTFPDQMAQVKASGAQTIIALGETPEGGPFFQQMRLSSVTAQVIGQRDFGAKRVLAEAGDAANGAVIFTEFAPELQGAATRDWNTAYKARNVSDANVIAVQYYDAVLWVAEAIRTGGVSHAGVKTGLESLKEFHGIMADYTFDKLRNGVHRFYLAKIAGGKLELVKILNESLTQ